VRLRELLRDAHPGVTLHHKAFLLRPEENPQARFTAYHLQHRQAARQLTGLEFRVPQVGDPYPRSSLPALAAAKWVAARDPERFSLFDLALFEAFFGETKDIGDPEVLAEVARSVGISDPGLREALRDRTYEDAVWNDHREAMERDIHSIPTVVIGDTVISGAVPIGEYRTALQAELRKREAEASR
jgi:predicted DsbA family dithiol-disulfide isomerase